MRKNYVPINKFPHMGEGAYVAICWSCFLHFFQCYSMSTTRSSKSSKIGISAEKLCRKSAKNKTGRFQYMDLLPYGEIYLWGRRTPYIFPHLLRADLLFKIKENQVFDHNFARSARIELRFWEVANLEKLNNFYHGHL